MSENGRGNPGRNDPSQDPVLCSPYEEPDRYWGLDRLGPGDEGPPSRAGPPSIHGGPVHAKDAKDSDPQIALELTTQDPERDHQRHPGQGEDLAEQRLSGRHPRHRAAPAPLG